MSEVDKLRVDEIEGAEHAHPFLLSGARRFLANQTPKLVGGFNFESAIGELEDSGLDIFRTYLESKSYNSDPNHIAVYRCAYGIIAEEQRDKSSDTTLFVNEANLHPYRAILHILDELGEGQELPSSTVIAHLQDIECNLPEDKVQALIRDISRLAKARKLAFNKDTTELVQITNHLEDPFKIGKENLKALAIPGEAKRIWLEHETREQALLEGMQSPAAQSVSLGESIKTMSPTLCVNYFLSAYKKAPLHSKHKVVEKFLPQLINAESSGMQLLHLVFIYSTTPELKHDIIRCIKKELGLLEKMIGMIKMQHPAVAAFVLRIIVDMFREQNGTISKNIEPVLWRIFDSVEALNDDFMLSCLGVLFYYITPTTPDGPKLLATTGISVLRNPAFITALGLKENGDGIPNLVISVFHKLLSAFGQVIKPEELLRRSEFNSNVLLKSLKTINYPAEFDEHDAEAELIAAKSCAHNSQMFIPWNTELGHNGIAVAAYAEEPENKGGLMGVLVTKLQPEATGFHSIKYGYIVVSNLGQADEYIFVYSFLEDGQPKKLDCDDQLKAEVKKMWLFAVQRYLKQNGPGEVTPDGVVAEIEQSVIAVETAGTLPISTDISTAALRGLATRPHVSATNGTSSKRRPPTTRIRELHTSGDIKIPAKSRVPSRQEFAAAIHAASSDAAVMEVLYNRTTATRQKTDLAREEHQMTLRSFIEMVQANYGATTTEANFDLVTIIDQHCIVWEFKSINTSGSNEQSQIDTGIGQLFRYAYRVKHQDQQTAQCEKFSKALLLSKKPKMLDTDPAFAKGYFDSLTREGLHIFWFEGGVLCGNEAAMALLG